MLNFNCMNTQNSFYGLFFFLWLFVIWLLYMMTSELVDILLLLQYKTFSNFTCKWRNSCWIVLYSVSPQEWKYVDENCLRLFSKGKNWSLVIAQIKFISSQSVVQGKLLWLQISSSYKTTFWIAIETFFSTSFINISLHYSTKVHQPRMVPWICGDNSVSLTLTAHLKRSWAKRWK